MTGSELIAQERQRQIEKEGWTAEHDDNHVDAILTQAAACYLDSAHTAMVRTDAAEYHEFPPRGQSIITWPWDKRDWKPSNDPIRNLVKAGALIAAEIDRLQRLSGKGESP